METWGPVGTTVAAGAPLGGGGGTGACGAGTGARPGPPPYSVLARATVRSNPHRVVSMTVAGAVRYATPHGPT
jgi:hypothetical protein